MRIVVAGFLVVVGIALFVSLQCTAKATAQDSVAASPYLIERVANNDWLLIDVRSPKEFAEGHIPGAVNIAKLAMKVLEDLDFSEVMHLEGDMLGWSAAGMTVDRM
jgi:rhodanese-related sulfurtransferase